MGVRIRDPIHNFIDLNEKEVDLVNTLAIQRLRRIRQLALACLVYPGALHTRFDHSLGVMHVAGLMGAALKLEPNEIEMVRYAALLHDLGHGPFSHVSEHILDRYAKRKPLESGQKKEKIHEIVTAQIIESDKQIVHILGESTCKKIVKLLSEGFGQPVLRSILSGPLDADKQDYLLRDSYFCGVQYGVFDIHQFLRSFTLSGKEDQKELAIEEKGLHALEQYILAKYYLTFNVYFHKVRLISDQMIIRAIQLGIDKDQIEDLRNLYTFDNSPEFFQRYVEWDDAKFEFAFGFQSPGTKGTKCSCMLERLRQRSLLKRIFMKRLHRGHQDFPAKVREALVRLSETDYSKLREDIERDIAGVLSSILDETIDPDFVIVHAFDIKSVREASKNDEAGILVMQDDTPTHFEQASTLFESINDKYSDQYVAVYAPVKWATSTDKKKIQKESESRIVEILEKRCSSAQKGVSA